MKLQTMRVIRLFDKIIIAIKMRAHTYRTPVRLPLPFRGEVANALAFDAECNC